MQKVRKLGIFSELSCRERVLCFGATAPGEGTITKSKKRQWEEHKWIGGGIAIAKMRKRAVILLKVGKKPVREIVRYKMLARLRKSSMTGEVIPSFLKHLEKYLRKFLTS